MGFTELFPVQFTFLLKILLKKKGYSVHNHNWAITLNFQTS